jgi:hypothetical protein
MEALLIALVLGLRQILSFPLTTISRIFAMLHRPKLVSVDPEGDDDRSARDSGALAPRRLSPLLALEIAGAGRASADPAGAARSDPAVPKTLSMLIGDRIA